MKLTYVIGGCASLALSVAAHATVITQTLAFTGSGFTLQFGDGSVAPIDPATITATITLDNSLTYDMATAGLTFSSNLPYPATFAYDPLSDILTLATFSDPDSCPNPADSFCTFVSEFSTTPDLFFFQQSTSSGGFFVAQTITASVAAVPEPSAWALAIVGIGGMGAALRRRRAIKVSYAS